MVNKVLSTDNMQTAAMIVGIIIVFCWISSRHIHEMAHLMGLTCYDAAGNVVACKIVTP